MMVKKEKWSVKAVAFILGVILCCNPFSALAEEKTATLDDIDYSAVYDYDYYIARYPDVVSVLGTDPKIVLKHFVTYGMSEGRRGNSSMSGPTGTNTRIFGRLLETIFLPTIFTIYGMERQKSESRLA